MSALKNRIDGQREEKRRGKCAAARITFIGLLSVREEHLSEPVHLIIVPLPDVFGSVLEGDFALAHPHVVHHLSLIE